MSPLARRLLTLALVLASGLALFATATSDRLATLPGAQRLGLVLLLAAGGVAAGSVTMVAHAAATRSA